MNGPNRRILIAAFGDDIRCTLGRIAIPLGLCVLASSAFALQKDTWKDVGPWKSGFRKKPIGSGYFWNEARGLIGSGVRPTGYYDSIGLFVPGYADTVSIYYTSDGGNSWIESVPAHKITGAVTRIWMVDSLVGYASIFSDVPHSYYRTYGKAALWKTTDGGLTWFDPFALDHLITDVYSQNGLLLFTQWDAYYTSYRWTSPYVDTFGGHYSFDDGATWQKNFRRGNGIAFSDSLNGVVTEMNADTLRNFWVTVDAGRTWTPTFTNLAEAWSVYAVPGERTYFVAGESQYYLPYTTVYRSTDGGFVWSPVVTFPDIHFSGAINGKGSTVYFQTDTVSYPGLIPSGMYRSDNLGDTWRWVGGPANSRDSRFVVTGCSGEVVYAFDAHGGVWKTTDGGDGTLEGGNPNDAVLVVPQTDFRVTCEPCTDSVQFTVYSGSCVDLTIDSVAPITSVDLLSARIGQKMINDGDSVHVKLYYAPLDDTSRTSIVRVYAHAGSRVITQDVTFDITKVGRTGIILSKPASTLTTSGCSLVEDSVYLASLGCPGMVLDSVVGDFGELHILGAVPDTVSATGTHLLRLLFAPDSSGTHMYRVQIHAHSNRRLFDTTLLVTAVSAGAIDRFIVPDTTHRFATRYCQLQLDSITVASTSCDSVWIDSVRVSSAAFLLRDTLRVIGSNAQASLYLSYSPNGIGSDTAHVRIVGHSRFGVLDTTLVVYGVNTGGLHPLELSDTLLDLTTTACLDAEQPFFVTNQGCDDLQIDSITSTSTDMTVTFDRSQVLHSNDTLPVTLTFAPDSAGSVQQKLHVFAHTSSGSLIDTVLTARATNVVAARPLALTTDTIYLPTKYCHAVERTITLANLGCPRMSIDSVRVEGDARGEFSSTALSIAINALDSAALTVRFDPDTSGRRTASLRLFGHLGEQPIDTVLSLIGRNFTAPEPYLAVSDSGRIGERVAIPIYFRSTLDTFAIHQFSAHLAFNTDILTPKLLRFEGTCAPQVLSSAITDDDSGARIEVQFADSLRDTASFQLPVVYVLADVSLSKEVTTPIDLDNFSTDVEPALTLCSVPTSQFTALLRCGDPLIQHFLQTGEASVSIVSVQPNPVSTNSEWNVTLTARETVAATSLELFNADGRRVERTEFSKLAAGRSTVAFGAPRESGDYFIVLRSERRISDVRKVSVVR